MNIIVLSVGMAILDGYTSEFHIEMLVTLAVLSVTLTYTSDMIQTEIECS